VVAVVTDSAANLPPDLAAELGIRVVPLEVRLGNERFRDGVDVGVSDFYDRLVEAKTSASTSAPSPGDYLEGFEAAGADEVVCVTIGSGLSAAHQQAAIAARDFAGRVEVVESRSATLGEGFVAIEAARAARGGGSLEGVAARAREIAERVVVFGAIETFEYLKRSGRVSSLQAYAATKLSIKPVFHLVEGEIRPSARPRTRGKALDTITSEVGRTTAGRPVHVGAFHARAREDAADLLERIEAECDVVERILVDATPAIGAHTGPGLVGVAFFTD
jgi:DegV family protein with EDD domain